MTQQELEDTWIRYMHRSDLQADIATTNILANQRVLQRLMRSDTDLADILADSPALLVHAGLMALMELAQDDTGLGRESQLFEDAASGYAMKYSIDNIDPVMRTN